MNQNYLPFSEGFGNFEPPSSCEFVSGLLAGAGSLGAGLLGFLGSSNAADAQTKALNSQIAFEQGVLQNQYNLVHPWLFTGQTALQNLASFLGIQPDPNNPSGQNILSMSPSQFAGIGQAPQYQTPTLSQFQSSPAYNWQLQQGVNAIQNAKGPTQGVLSGNTLQAIQTYGNNLANQDWYNWLNNYNNQFNMNSQNYWNQYNAAANQQQNLWNRFLTLSTGGQQAATLTGPQSDVTNSIGGALANVGTAQASGILGQYGSLANLFNPSNSGGTNIGNAFSSFGTALQNLFNNNSANANLGGDAYLGLSPSQYSLATGQTY